MQDGKTFARRVFLRGAASIVVTVASALRTRAESYPSRPVHIMVGFPPAGGGDILARLMSQWLSARLGQPFIVENRPGASYNLATEAVARASADGYTLLLAFTSNAINATLYRHLNFNFSEDIAPVAGFMRTPLVMVVNPSFPAETVPEFIAYAKANPGKINMASAMYGGPSHLAGELFKAMTGITMLHVPYRGDAAALLELLSGRVQVLFSGIGTSIEQIRARKLRAFAVTTAARSHLLPEIPALAEFVPGYEASAWFGLAAPRHTPIHIIEILNGQVNAALADANIKERIVDLGGTPLPGSPADFGKLIADDVEKWAKVIKLADIKVD